jgi:hypothetical protein
MLRLLFSHVLAAILSYDLIIMGFLVLALVCTNDRFSSRTAGWDFTPSQQSTCCARMQHKIDRIGVGSQPTSDAS